jgi:hypothetical protein
VDGNEYQSSGVPEPLVRLDESRLDPLTYGDYKQLLAASLDVTRSFNSGSSNSVKRGAKSECRGGRQAKSLESAAGGATDAPANNLLDIPLVNLVRKRVA